jgi:hypothetical protein
MPKDRPDAFVGDCLIVSGDGSLIRGWCNLMEIDPVHIPPVYGGQVQGDHGERLPQTGVVRCAGWEIPVAITETTVDGETRYLASSRDNMPARCMGNAR